MNSKRKQLQGVILDLLSEGQVVEVPVFGISMFPFFMPGIVVRVKSVAFNDIQKGDVLFFESNDKLILHRVVRKKVGMVQCKGDSLIKHDSVIGSSSKVGVVIAWKRSGTFKSTRSFGFRLYAAIMVYLHRITGYLIWPFALVWNKWDRVTG